MCCCSKILTDAFTNSIQEDHPHQPNGFSTTWQPLNGSHQSITACLYSINVLFYYQPFIKHIKRLIKKMVLTW